MADFTQEFIENLKEIAQLLIAAINRNKPYPHKTKTFRKKSMDFIKKIVKENSKNDMQVLTRDDLKKIRCILNDIITNGSNISNILNQLKELQAFIRCKDLHQRLTELQVKIIFRVIF